MNSKTRLIAMTLLLIVSFFGGLVGECFDADVGFVIGIVGTYILLSVVLIVAGKVDFTRNS
ncbi:hypothetical protein F7U67_001627 [Vibrio metschnikovii]|nr:hypothetical protein [Vibrio metschnikovii]HAS4037867.1 hypothetical protein [Vibrio cholerae]HDP8606482.1 hypothetical protein [Vibrio cholerae]HDV5624499.1 hypothetical protein [Vibrio cholerae]